jgi:PTS system nitrogen regulatory IIA component
MIKLSKYLDEDLIVFLNAKTRDEALKTMIHHFHQLGKITDIDHFYQAIVDREKIVSTGIGMGVAIPHAKLTHYNDFFIAIGILKQGLDWNALDGAPVRLIFMIGGPDDKQTEYLQILSKLTHVIKDELRRKKLLTLNSPTDIIGIFKAF